MEPLVRDGILWKGFFFFFKYTFYLHSYIQIRHKSRSCLEGGKKLAMVRERQGEEMNVCNVIRKAQKV